MSINSLQGRATTDPNNPQPPGICDRCGFKYLLADLSWQYDFRGNSLKNLRLLVCERCLDEAQEQLRPVILPPDPVPVLDARPGTYYSQQGGVTPANPQIQFGQAID